MTDARARLAEDDIVFTRFADMPSLEIMSVAHTRRSFNAFHETYTLCANLTAGGGEWSYRGRRERGLGAMTMLMEPGEVHRTHKLLGEVSSFHVFHLNAGWVASMSAQADLATLPHFSAGVVTDLRVHRAALALRACAAAAAPLLERETRQIALLNALLRHAEKPPKAGGQTGRASPQLRRARDYLIEHHDRKILLDDLASAAGMSKYHLARSFTRAFGMPPHEFLSHVRIARARTQLAASPRGVADIGEAFFDQSHFAKVFRHITGITPSRYAAAAMTPVGAGCRSGEIAA